MTRALAAAGVVVVFAACEPPVLPVPDAGPSLLMTRPPDCIALPTDVDFGEVPTNSLGAVQFFLSNHTLKPIVLTVGPVSDPFGSTEAGKIEVRPDVQLPLRFSFRPPDARLHFTDLLFTGGVGCTPQTIRLHGLGLGGIAVPDTVEFDNLPPGQTSRRSLQVRNTRRTDVEVLLFTTPSPPLVVSTTTFTVPALGTFDLPLEITPTQLGTFFTNVQLQARTGEVVSTLVVASAGAPTIALSQRAIDVPRLPVLAPMLNERLSRSVLVTNSGEADLRIDRVEVIAGAGSLPTELVPFFFVGTRVAPGTEAQLAFQFEPTATLGPREWTVRVHSNDPLAPTVELGVTATVVEQAPCMLEVTASPSILTLNASSLPTSASLALTNPNPTACLVDGLRLVSCNNGGFALQPPDDQFTLDSHATRMVTVSANSVGECFLVWNTWGASFGVTVPVRSQ